LAAQMDQGGQPVPVRGAEVLELQTDAARVISDRLLELGNLTAREPTFHRDSAGRPIAENRDS